MKDKITTYLFIIIIYVFFLLNIILPDKDISESERRSLEQFPKININQIMNKNAMNNFDTYVLDQFVFRDKFRSLKANVVYKLFNKIDNNKLYIKDDMIFKSEYPINEKSIKKFVKKINNIKENYLKNNKVYYSIIPDKNYYINDSKYLNLNYDKLYDIVLNSLNDISYIDLRKILSINDYYRTDTHWKQENLIKVVNEFGKYMDFNITDTYIINKYSPFYGVYYGQSGLNIKPDTITYLTNSIIDNAVVKNYEKNNVVYDLDKLGSIDSYDLYLSGSSPFIEIENKNQLNGRELVIFRDSFGSSLAPLLISAYSKITLIDLRYMTLEIMNDLINFDNQDVLFLYSTLIVNNSDILKD